MHVREDENGALCFGEGNASLRIGPASNDANANVNVNVDANSKVDANNDAWYLRHIERGYAWLPDAAIDALLPPALSMERLTAVSFNKGCFPGQEIAARLHYLGGHKKHLHVVTSDRSFNEGDSLSVDGRAVGMVLMCNASTSQPMSLVVLDDTAVQADTLEIEGTRIHIVTTFDA
jgi:folate-binding protein YgfZ